MYAIKMLTSDNLDFFLNFLAALVEKDFDRPQIFSEQFIGLPLGLKILTFVLGPPGRDAVNAF